MKKTLIILMVILLSIIFALPVMAEDAPDRIPEDWGTANMNGPGTKHLSSDDDIVIGKNSTVAKASKNIIVYVNGQQVAFQGQQTIMVGSRVLIPVRGMFEKIRANVEWNAKEKKVTATKGNIKITLYAAKTKAYKGSQVITLDQPAKVTKGRVLVPLRFISESIGATVNWVKAENAVYVNLK